MSCYNFEYFIKDFVERTNKNLLNYNNELGYEVTQLVNSLFGLLIVPNEKYKYRGKDNGVSEYTLSKAPGYDDIRKLIGVLKESNKYANTYPNQNYNTDRFLVSNFLNHMRNSLAHSGNKGLHFLPFEENKEISGIIFYDRDEVNHTNGIFCAELNIHQIRILTNALYKMYKEPLDNRNHEERREEYKSKIAECREFLKNNS